MLMIEEAKLNGYNAKDYDVVERNCFDFAQHLITFLNGETIPEKYIEAIDDPKYHHKSAKAND